MPQLVFFAAIGIAAYYGYKSFTREAARVTARVRRAEQESANRSMGTLIEDPKTGEYHVEKR